MHRLMVIGVAATLILGCSVIPGGTRPPSSNAPSGDAPSALLTTTPDATHAVVSVSIPLCGDVPDIAAPEGQYADTPMYVANEMPTDELRAWAQRKPGFEEIWIDRDHHGWIVLAFSVDAELRQAELETEFPNVGVVAVQVDWTMSELQALQQRVRPLMLEHVYSTGIWVTKGLVSIGIGPLTPERVAPVEEHFAGERVCLEGVDPALLPPDGPQPAAGDGWRLLADADGVGPAYRTGIAYDDASYAQLWDSARLDNDRPSVDFDSEVAIWFGAVTGSSCPNIRLDNVFVNPDLAVVYAEIVNLDYGGCTADIHSHAYVVALERARLPAAPFAIQLNADGPPRGAPEERTVVDVDLSEPGSIAQPGEVHGDNTPPEPYFVGPGDFIEDGYPTDYRQSTLCGLEWLGPLNDVYWRTEKANQADWIPTEWVEVIDDGHMILEVVLTVNPPRLEAKANRHTVVYFATVKHPPGCD
jgi:hypothetical protein